MFKIVERAKFYCILPIVIILAGLIAYFVGGGFVMDVDFAGGTVMYVDMGKEVDLDEVAKVIEKADERIKSPKVLASDDNVIVIQTSAVSELPAKEAPKAEEVPAETEAPAAVETAATESAATETKAEATEPATAEETNEVMEIAETPAEETVIDENDIRAKMIAALKENFEIKDEAVLSVEDVSATMGAELRGQALKAALIACVLMLLYITIRFEFFTGAAAVICLLHDVLIMLAFYAIFRMPMNANFIAAMLTIIGYSINNTIVVFDRIRENQKKALRSDYKVLVNTSLKQTLNRSLFTTLTTIVPVIMLYVLGVDSIKDFALPLMVGLLAGTFSSVLLAGPIWYAMKTAAKNRKLKKAKR